MVTSWHNFFFVSFDPAGFISVDKPPLGLWLQATSAELFGFSGLSLLLPQAISGILSVLMLYHLVKRCCGPQAGVIAALTLAVTPVWVAVDRNNTMDSELILVLLVAAYTVILAAETGELKWLLLCAALLGVGFNIKMLQAFLVLPAFYLLYLLTAPLSWSRRAAYLILATLIMLCVSIPWLVIVDLTPPASRPYVGSSRDNSVTNLVIQYNGWERIQSSDEEEHAYEIGEPGPLRFLDPHLAGQVSLMLPFALITLIFGCIQHRRKRLFKQQQRQLLLWAMWLLPQLFFFSLAGFFHRYYLAMLAPAIAALVGIGTMMFWHEWRHLGSNRWAFLFALLGCAGVQVYIVAAFPDWRYWLLPLIVGLSLSVGGLLLIADRKSEMPIQFWSVTAFGAGILILLIVPLIWSGIVTLSGTDPARPYGGPQDVSPRAYDVSTYADPSLINYLEANRKGSRFLAATFRISIAAPLILATGEPVMAIGGFSGADPILTVDQLSNLVKQGDVRYFPITSNINVAPEQVALWSWVKKNCTRVPAPLGISVGPVSVHLEVYGSCLVGPGG